MSTPTMPRVLFCYSNIPANPTKSHTGLKNNAINSVKVLRRVGIYAAMIGINTLADLKAYLAVNPVPNVIIQALFLKPDELDDLCTSFPSIEFAVVCHSGFKFLSAGEITLLFASMNKASTTANLVVACNSASMCADLEGFRPTQPTTYLPNLYPVNPDSIGAPNVYSGGTIRGGLFCSPRPEKNMKNQAVAFGIVCQRLRTTGVFMYNVGRADGGPSSPATQIINSIENVFANHPLVTTKQINWQDQPDHLMTVRSCDITFQCSDSETFNIVSCDSITQGVPVCASPAVRWLPDYWKAQPDSAADIARVALGLLYNPNAVSDGLQALQTHNATSLHAWRAYLYDGITNVGASAFVRLSTALKSTRPQPETKGKA